MKITKIAISAVLAAGLAYADDSADIAALKAQLQDLSKQVTELKGQQQSMNLDALNKQVKELKVKTGGDNLKWDADFRTEWDNINYKMSGRQGGYAMMFPPSAFQNLGMAAQYSPTVRGYMGGITSGTGASFLPSGVQFGAGDPVFGSQPSNYNKPSLLSERLELGMKAAPTSNLSFVGKLSMNKAFGAPANNAQNNAPSSYSTFDWINNEQLINNTVRVKEAYAIYFDQMGDVPYTASIGRRPSTDGLPINLSEGNKDANSPLAHLINVEYDGASILTNWEKVTGIPGMSFKLCAGVGATNAAAWGNGMVPAYSNQNNMNGDVNLFGFIFVPYDDGQYSVHSMWFNALNMIGFSQNNFASFQNAYGQYYSSAYNSLQMTGAAAGAFGMGGSATAQTNAATAVNYYQNGNGLANMNNNMPAFANVGNLQGGTIMFMSNGIGNNWGDFFDRSVFFGSWAATKTQPSATVTNLNGLAVPGTFGTMTQQNNGMLGSPKSQIGTSWWFGVNFPALVTSDGKFGLEYNQGSKYWAPVTQGEDSFAGSRIGTRGQAFMGYYDQPLLKNLSMMISYEVMNYNYAGSGGMYGYEGTPWTQAQASAQNLPYIKSASDARVFLRYRY